MKLKIKKIREVYSTNIFGKPLATQTYYRIYQPTLFGKKWLFYQPIEGGKFKVMLDYEDGPLCDFSGHSGYCKTFRTHGSAANFIKGIEANPDNYIQGYELSEYVKGLVSLHKLNERINKSVNQQMI